MKKFIVTISSITAIILLYTSLLFAQSSVVKFDRLSIEDGLSQSTVRCILQDVRGFMWFGTDAGLNRYDGYTFKTYKRDLENPGSLSNGLIWSLYEDRLGTMWVGTDVGLNRYDREQNRFTRYFHDPENPYSVSDNSIRAILEDSRGVLWIGTNGGLCEYDRDNDVFIRHMHDPGDLNSIGSDRIRSLYEDDSGNLWIGTYDGLNRYDSGQERFERIGMPPEAEDAQAGTRVRDVVEDSTGVLWIGTNRGLFEFDPESETYTAHRHEPGNPNSISSNSIRFLHIDRTGALLIGTTGGGLDWYDGSYSIFFHFRHDPAGPSSISSDELRSIYEDRAGILWIGTYKRGLSKYDRMSNKFLHFHTDNLFPNSINNNSVRAFYEDDYGFIWIGTFGGGINMYDRNAARYTYFQHDPANPRSLSHDRIYAITEDRHGYVWIGTNGGGLNRFDRKTGYFEHFRYDPDDPGSLSSDRIRVIYEDSNGTLWIGTNGGGLNQFERDSETFMRLINDPYDPVSISNNSVYALCEDRSGMLWAGTVDGLNRLDRENNRFTRFKFEIDDSTSISDKGILSIYEDSEGALWIGTYGGLNRFNRDSETFTRYTEKDGLANDVIYGILEDDDGNLWMSTNKGISKFNPRTESFKNYDVRDGLQGSEYYPGAYYKSKRGEMFFGGSNGFNAFLPGEIVDNTHIPPIVITDFRLFNESVLPKKPGRRTIITKTISEADEICLYHHQDVFSFEFAALDYSAPEKNRYAYKMEGFNEDWTYSDSRRFVTYTNLPPGEYVFRVRGSNNNDVWNDDGTSVSVTITPPFWQTTWFTVFFVIFAVAVVYTGYKLRIRKIERRRKILESQVAERTAEIEKKSHQLSDQKNKLVETLDALRVSWEQYHGIFDSVSDSLIIFDRNGSIVEANPEACRSFGYEKPEFIGMNGRNLMHPDYRDHLREFMRIFDETGHFQGEAVCVRNDASDFNVDARGTNFMYSGEPHLLVIVRDVTERKKAENQIKQQLNLIEVLVETIPSPVYLKNTEGKYIVCNKAFESYFGKTRSQVVGKTEYEILPDHLAKQFHGLDLKLMMNGGAQSFECKVPFADGSLHDVIYHKAVVQQSDESPEGVVGVITDITELKEKTHQLEQLLEELKAAELQIVQAEKMASLGNLVAGIAHEVNNPVGAVISAADVAKRCIAKINETIEQSKNIEGIEGTAGFTRMFRLLTENNDVIVTASRRISTIVKSLKNFARLDESEFQETDIHEGIESTLTLVHHQLKNKAEVIREFGNIPKIRCYPNQLNQVFMNLFVNAAQAIEDTGEIRIRTYAEDSSVVIKVADNGKGIPADKIGKVFDPGFTTKGVGVGTGLGLSICYNIVVEKHNGQITVQSEPGKGTEFTVRLPATHS